MTSSAHYHGSRGAAYHRSQQRVEPSVRAALGARKISRHLPASERIVDFGCGNGALLSILRARDRIGVDAIEENRASVRDRGIEALESLREIPDQWADAVVSNHALEHTLDPLGELREVHRVLRVGGTLVLYVPADDWRVNGEYRVDDRNHHLFTWTPSSLGNLVAEAGFEVRESKVEHRAWPGRATSPLAKALPPRALDYVMVASAFVTRRREILTVAVRE